MAFLSSLIWVLSPSRDGDSTQVLVVTQMKGDVRVGSLSGQWCTP
ncbi:hypothetical protein [Lentzea sp. HUAS12]|nr:hypothetical protein [Lentzea sp. HUAS12]